MKSFKIQSQIHDKFKQNMINADSILAFLDNAERAECYRKIPTNAEIKKQTEIREKNLRKEIGDTKCNIEELTKLQNEIISEKEKYRFSVMKIQASMDRTLKEKEELSKNIELLTNQFNEIIKNNQKLNVQDIVSGIVQKAIMSIIEPMKAKLANKLNQIAFETARQAQAEFAPHINQLKSTHSSEVSKIKTQMKKEIESIKQKSIDQTKTEISEIRSQFYDQTDHQITLINQQNMKTLESLRMKNERERLRFESNLERINRQTESEVKELKTRYQREYEREQSKMMRLINDCKNDVALAKSRAVAQINNFNQTAQKKETFYSELSEAQVCLDFEESNREYIESKKQEIQSELNDYKHELDLDTEKRIGTADIELSRTISVLENDNAYFRKEVERLSELKNREINFRNRQEKRTMNNKDSIDNLINSISQLRDRMFEIQSEMITLNSSSKNDITQANARHYEKCQKIKERIYIEKSQRESLEKVHKKEVDAIISKHKNTISQTSSRVKSIIASKDAQIEQLQKQYVIEKERIDQLMQSFQST